MRAELPIDPRIQARRRAVRRDGERRKRSVLVASAVMAVLGAAAWGVGRTPLLAVQHVHVLGTGPTTRDVALATAGLDHRRQMLDLSRGGMAGRLEALPWVARAVVRRRWPTTVEIVLTSRVPVAQVGGPDGQPAVVDAQGRVLAVGPEAAALIARTRYCRLVGVGRSGAAGSALGPAFGPALALVTAVPPALPPAGPRGPGLEAVTATADGTWSALLSSGISVVFGSSDHLEAKVVAMRTVLEKVDLSGVATVDVRVPDTPVLTPGTGPTIVSTIPRG